MYSNQQVIEMIHNDESYYEALENIMRGHPLKGDLIDDLYSELILIFAEEDNERLNKLVNKDQLKFYWVRIAMNQWQSSSSPFYRKYRKDQSEHLEYDTDLTTFRHQRDLERTYEEVEEDDIFFEESYSALVKRITEQTLDQMYWYKSKLFKLYVKFGSYRAVSEETLIPENSVGNTIRDVKEELQRKIDKELQKIGH